MPKDDLLFQLGLGIGQMARGAADWLGLGSDPVGEDVAAQVDGTDALYRSITWAPALSGKSVTAAAQLPKGKRIAEPSALFGYRGNDPVDLEFYPDVAPGAKYVPPVTSLVPAAISDEDFTTVEILPGGPSAPRDRGQFPNWETVGVFPAGTEVDEFTLYPSYFITEKKQPRTEY